MKKFLLAGLLALAVAGCNSDHGNNVSSNNTTVVVDNTLTKNDINRNDLR
jgi:uncharacterized protein YcfL